MGDIKVSVLEKDGVEYDVDTEMDLVVALSHTKVNWKIPCLAADDGTSVSISSAPSSIDGVTLVNGARVLLGSQTLASENGIYIFNGVGQPMTRSPDMDTAEKTECAVVPVLKGATNQATFWYQYEVGVVLGTTSLTFFALGSNVVGGGGGNTASVDVDFGLAESSFATATVSATWMTASTNLSLTILPNTLDHDNEDALIEEIKCSYGNVVAGTGFDVFVHAPNSTWGRYTIKIIGV